MSKVSIPFFTQPEIGYKKYEGYYVPIGSFEEMAEAIKDFKDNNGLYRRYSENNSKKAQEYHIENIAKKYMELLPI